MEMTEGVEGMERDINGLHLNARQNTGWIRTNILRGYVWVNKHRRRK